MSISNISSVHSAQALTGPHRSTASTDVKTEAPQTTSIKDEVRISHSAREQSVASAEQTDTSPVRYDLVNRIRAEIAAGTYESPEKLSFAVERMTNALNAQ